MRFTCNDCDRFVRLDEDGRIDNGIDREGICSARIAWRGGFFNEVLRPKLVRSIRNACRKFECGWLDEEESCRN